MDKHRLWQTVNAYIFNPKVYSITLRLKTKINLIFNMHSNCDKPCYNSSIASFVYTVNHEQFKDDFTDSFKLKYIIFEACFSQTDFMDQSSLAD